jgi:hypothetical protein
VEIHGIGKSQCHDAKHVWQVRFMISMSGMTGNASKLRYMHRNPVQRGLVREPEEWRWSSFRYYAFGECGLVLVTEQRQALLKIKGKAVDEVTIPKVS